MIVVTDGAATDSDELAEILPTLHRLDREGIIEVVPIALDNDCRPLLTQVFGKEPSSVSELDFALLFRDCEVDDLVFAIIAWLRTVGLRLDRDRLPR